MNKPLILCTLLAGLGTAPAFADDSEPKQGAWGFGIGAATGAAIAGPPGAVGGAIIGALIGRGKDLEQNLAYTEQSLQQSQQQLAQLKDASNDPDKAQGMVASKQLTRLPAQTDLVRDIAKGIATGFESQVYFRTGSAMVEPHYEGQLKRLATVMDSFPNLDLQLYGHADRRGSNESNLQLSELRLEGVRRVLLDAGIAEQRIHSDPMGERTPVSKAGDAEAYDFDRRVQLRFQLAPVATTKDALALTR